MSVEAVLAFLAGALVGYIVGSVMEYVSKENQAINAAAGALKKAGDDALAATKAIDDKTQAVVQETASIGGKDLADAINSDYSTPPDVPGVRGPAAGPGAGKPTS